jgi:alcohol dehydrogenase
MKFSTGSTYRAAVLIAPHRVQLQEKHLPELKPHEAQVRVHAAGVCGTDLAIHDGDYAVPLPIVLGHEWVGTVEAVGDARDHDWIGRRVVGEINDHCAAIKKEPLCAACNAGLPTHCQNRTVMGIVSHSGAFAERAVAPTANLRPVPDAMSDEAAIFVEPLAAALQTFALTPIKPGETVVVLGCGRLGVLVGLAAKSMGGQLLVFADRREYWELAQRAGIAAETALSPEAIARAVENATHGLGADIVVEATGSPDGLALALDCVRPRGTIALKSTPGVPVERFDLTRAVVNEVRLQGSRCGQFNAALQFWERHRPPLERLIVAEFPLDRIIEAIAQAHLPGKVLVRCARKQD